MARGTLKGAAESRRVHPLQRRTLLAGLALAMPAPASAEMVLSQVIVDLEPNEAPRDDIEVSNTGSERMYVLAEPFEILNPGTKEESRVDARDPLAAGLLVSPQRIVLAPGERRVIRVALTGDRPARERRANGTATNRSASSVRPSSRVTDSTKPVSPC